MNIFWAGIACFKIETNSGTIIIDPFNDDVGLKLSHRKADLALSSSNAPAHGNIEAIRSKDGNVKIIQGPGEYEIKNIFIYGIGVKPKKANKESAGDIVIYRIEAEGMSLVHLGALKEPLENGQLEHLEKTDILFIPVGGGMYCNAEEAVSLVSQIAPRIVIPMCYKIPGLKLRLDGVEKFLKDIGVKPEEAVSKLKIAKKDLPAQEMKIQIMEIS